MEDAIRSMTRAIDDALDHGLDSLWLYGSAVLGDFRLGWSDIDFIAFADGTLTEAQANRLLTLRQDLSAFDAGNPYYRCFEGVIVNRQEYETGRYARLVYWGTSGQRVTNRFALDPFARMELVRYGRRVYGIGENPFTEPTWAELAEAICRHYEAIRQYAVQTDERLYSCGWLLDMARCVYTLRHHDVIAKTRAGEWALSEHLFPEEGTLQKALMIRRDPLLYKDLPEIRTWLCALGPTVQRYADVLERELMRCEG